jgi:hypothetical protein
MSIMMYPRPRESAWVDLVGGRMTKTAAGRGFFRGLFGRLRAPARPGMLGAKLPKPPGPFGATMRQGLGAIKKRPGWLGGGLGLAAGAVGVDQAHKHLVQAPAARDAAAAADAAAIAEANKPPPVSGFDQGLNKVTNWATENWPLLAGGGALLGGAGLWYKNRRDQEEEEDERALLSGMHPKMAMINLAREFPIQVGFLARCGERQLNDTEVRAAVEKCAAISDDMAEDWIRFFAGAAGLEAGATSSMVKASAISLGYNQAFADATKQHPTSTLPPPPAVKPVAPVQPAAQPPAQPTQPVAQPTQPVAQPAAPVATKNRWNIPTLTEGMAALPDRPPTAPTRPALTNTQRMMAQAPKDRIIAQRAQWRNEYNAASNAGDQAWLKRLQANRPGAAPGMGRAGADRNPLVNDEALRRKNLVETGYEGELDAYRQHYADYLGKDRWFSSPTRIGEDQARYADMINSGVSPEDAAKRNFSDPTNDPTVGSMARGFGRNMANILPGMVAMPGAIGADIYNMIKDEAAARARGEDRPDPSWRYSAAAGRDILSPFTGMMGPQHNEALEQDVPGGESMARDVMPRVSRQLADVAGAPNKAGYNPVTRWAAGVGSDLTSQYLPLGNAAALGIGAAGLPTTGVMGGVGTGMKLISGGGPGIMAGWSALNEGYNQLPGTGRAGMTGRQQEMTDLAMSEAANGQKLPTLDQIPTTLDPDARAEFKQTMTQGGLRAQNEERQRLGLPPLNKQQADAFVAKQSAPIDAAYKQQDLDQIALKVPGTGIVGPDGKQKFNPLSKLELPKDLNPRDNRAFMTPEMTAHIETLFAHDSKSFDEATKSLDPALQKRLERGEELSTADKEVLQRNGVNVPELTATAYRMGQSRPLLMARDMFNGDMVAAEKAANTPEAYMAAAQKDHELADLAARNAAASGTDFMSSLSKIWGDLGPMGQMLAVGGLALGTIGMMTSLLGEGGMGSILMTLLGGLGVGLAANKANLLPTGLSDMINPALESLGLGDLMGGAQAEAPGAAAPGAAPAAPPNAAAQVGVPNVFDPAARQKLMAAPPQEQDKTLQMMMARDKSLGENLASAASWFGYAPKSVLARAQKAIPGVTMPEVQALINSYNRLKTQGLV